MIERPAETFADPHSALEALRHRQAARGPQFVLSRSICGQNVWTVSDWATQARPARLDNPHDLV